MPKRKKLNSLLDANFDLINGKYYRRGGQADSGTATVSRIASATILTKLMNRVTTGCTNAVKASIMLSKVKVGLISPKFWLPDPCCDEHPPCGNATCFSVKDDKGDAFFISTQNKRYMTTVVGFADAAGYCEDIALIHLLEVGHSTIICTFMARRVLEHGVEQVLLYTVISKRDEFLEAFHQYARSGLPRRCIEDIENGRAPFAATSQNSRVRFLLDPGYKGDVTIWNQVRVFQANADGKSWPTTFERPTTRMYGLPLLRMYKTITDIFIFVLGREWSEAGESRVVLKLVSDRESKSIICHRCVFSVFNNRLRHLDSVKLLHSKPTDQAILVLRCGVAAVVINDLEDEDNYGHPCSCPQPARRNFSLEKIKIVFLSQSLCAASTPTRLLDYITDVAVAPDGCICILSQKRMIIMLDALKCNVLRKINLNPLIPDMIALKFSLDGFYVSACTRNDNRFVLMDINGNLLLCAAPNSYPDGSRLEFAWPVNCEPLTLLEKDHPS